MKYKYFFILATTLAACFSTAAFAAITYFETNDVNTNYIFLFADPGARNSTPLTFNSLSFSGDINTSGWALAQSLDPVVAVLNGPAVTPGAGTYDLDFNAEKTIVSMQWSEIVYSGSNWSVLSDGTREYNSTLGLWQDIGTPFTAVNTQYITDYFNGLPPSPVPIPASFWLCLSAIVFCAMKKKKSGGYSCMKLREGVSDAGSTPATSTNRRGCHGFDGARY